MKATEALLILIASGLVFSSGCRPESGMSKKEIITAKNFPLCHELNRDKTLSDLLSASPMKIKPFEQGKRISGTRIECLILPSCTQVSPIDPLDP